MITFWKVCKEWMGVVIYFTWNFTFWWNVHFKSGTRIWLKGEGAKLPGRWAVIRSREKSPWLWEGCWTQNLWFYVRKFETFWVFTKENLQILGFTGRCWRLCTLSYPLKLPKKIGVSLIGGRPYTPCPWPGATLGAFPWLNVWMGFHSWSLVSCVQILINENGNYIFDEWKNESAEKKMWFMGVLIASLMWGCESETDCLQLWSMCIKFLYANESRDGRIYCPCP